MIKNKNNLLFGFLLGVIISIFTFITYFNFTKPEFTQQCKSTQTTQIETPTTATTTTNKIIFYEKTELPKFEDYKVKMFTGVAAKIKFEGFYKLEKNPPVYLDWREMFKEYPQEKNNAFNGHYLLYRVQNGSLEYPVAIDTETGKISQILDSKIGYLSGSVEYEVQKDSNLLKVKIDNKDKHRNVDSDLLYEVYKVGKDLNIELIGNYKKVGNDYIKTEF